VRPFGDWSQVCDDVRGGRHLCYLETVARHEGLSIGWRLARTRDGRSMALIILPRDASAQDGVTVEFGEMSRTATPLICDKAVCVATFPVAGPMLSLLARQKDARIYFRRDGNPVSIVAGLRGMEQALLDLTAKPIASPVATPRRTATTTAAVSATPKTKPTPSPWQGTR
jgi:invasion protein IalB